jgi:iron complex outermembrane recepter protein
VERPLYQNLSIVDSAAPDGRTVTLVNLTSGNASLQPEEGESFTVGFDFSPESIPNLTISSTYFDVKYDGRIANPPRVGPVTAIYSQAEALAPFIDRSPDPAEVQAIFATGRVTDRARTGAAGVEAIYDNRIVNIAESTQTGADVTLRYTLHSARGDFGLSLGGYRTFELDHQAANTVPGVPLLDLVGFPVGFKAVTGLTWDYRGFSSSLYVRHADEYANQFFTPAGTVDSWTTADLQFGYRVAESNSGVLDGLAVALNLQNVTDEEPPFVVVPDAINTALYNPGYDPVNASPIGRAVSLHIAKRW